MIRERLSQWSHKMAYAGLFVVAAGLVVALFTGKMGWVPGVILALGTVLLLAAALGRPADVRRALTGRQARYGSNALAMSLILLAILAIVNFLSNRHHARWDLTGTRQYSLSGQTIQILKDLKEPVKITAFYSPADSTQATLKDLLAEYMYHTDKLSLEVVDPDQKPAVARQYGITSYGTIVFERGSRRQDTFSTDEQSITSAILKVSRDEQKGIYFITGHKERNSEGYADDGFSAVKTLLEKNNYKVGTLNLAMTSTIPSDAAALIIASPQTDYAEAERKALSAYLDGGGKLMVLLDPAANVDLNSVLEPYGVRFRNDLVVDLYSSFFGDPLTPLTTRYPYSMITKDMTGLTSFFPYARSVERTASMPEGATITDLITTSDQSWGETNLAQRQVQRDDADVAGPLTLMAQVQKGNTRLVLVGDSDFAANSVLNSVRGAFGNADLFLNAVNWLAEEESLIAISPKTSDVRTVFLTPAQMRVILYSSALVLPAAVLVIGMLIWWRRR